MTRRSVLTRQRAFLFAIVAGLLLLAAPTQAAAQAEPAAYGPGSFIQVGGTGSLFQADYGQHHLGGASVFVDAHLYRRIGVEAEARSLVINQDENVHESTYLVGPRISIFAGKFAPYTKILIGRGNFYFPFHYAQGSYFVFAPGGGVDWRVGKGRLTIRLVDVEFQKWPWFTYGPLKPYGVSSGIALRVF